MSEPPRPQIALLDAPAEILVDLAAVSGIDWLDCRSEAPGRYVFQRQGAVLSILDFARPVFDLPDLIAIFGWSDRAGFDRLLLDWRAVLPALPMAITWIEVGAILPQALTEACAQLVQARAYAGRLAFDLAAYRRDFERMQRSFARLERYVSEAGLGAVREVFAIPRGKAAVSLGGAAGARSLRQALPVDSLGLAGIAIVIAAAPGEPGPPLAVGLAAIETGETIATWSLDPAGTQAGWLELMLERAIDESALSLVLTLDYAAGATGWAMGLGPPNPIAAWCAQGDPGGGLPAPLALRLQATLPGSRLRARLGAVLAERMPRPASFALPEAAYLTVSEVPLSPGVPAEGAVACDRAFGFIQVHPLRHGAVAAARMEVMAPAESWRLSAAIHLAHEAANPVRFGILVAPFGHEVPRPELAAVEDGAAGFSGWITLAALERRSISALLPDHAGRGLIVYLLTRQDDEPSFAWARFSDIALHALPGR